MTTNPARDMLIARALTSAFAPDQIANFIGILMEQGEINNEDFSNLAIECDICPHFQPFGDCTDDICSNL